MANWFPSQTQVCSKEFVDMIEQQDTPIATTVDAAASQPPGEVSNSNVEVNALRKKRCRKSDARKKSEVVQRKTDAKKKSAAKRNAKTPNSTKAVKKDIQDNGNGDFDENGDAEEEEDDDDDDDDEDKDEKKLFGHAETIALVNYRIDMSKKFESSARHSEFWNAIRAKMIAAGHHPRDWRNLRQKYTKLRLKYRNEFLAKKKQFRDGNDFLANANVMVFDDEVMSLLHEHSQHSSKNVCHAGVQNEEEEVVATASKVPTAIELAFKEMASTHKETGASVAALATAMTMPSQPRIAAAAAEKVITTSSCVVEGEADPKLVYWLSTFNRQVWAANFTKRYVDFDGLFFLEKSDFEGDEATNKLGLPFIIARQIWAKLEELRAANKV